MNCHRFIIVDDDPINNLICKEFIRLTVREPHHVIDFTSPEKALEYISSYEKQSALQRPVVILLDLNMPTMSGWDFIAQFEKSAPETRDNFRIYIVSSSINPRDMEDAAANPRVKDYVVKPVSEAFIRRLIDEAGELGKTAG